MHLLNCCVLFGLLFAPIVAVELQTCQDPRLNNCASCVIGAPFSVFPLQVFSKPAFNLPEKLQIANSYDIRTLALGGFNQGLSNVTCKWNKDTKTCSVFTDFPSPPDPNFVYPRRPSRSRDLDFDLYTRMENSRACVDGKQPFVRSHSHHRYNS
jgi:hypothetical protein